MELFCQCKLGPVEFALAWLDKWEALERYTINKNKDG